MVSSLIAVPLALPPLLELPAKHQDAESAAAHCCLLLSRRSSSTAEAPLVQTLVQLPHINLEALPLYIHAGQSLFLTHALIDCD